MAVQKLINLVEYKKGKRPQNLENTVSKGSIPYVDIEAFEKGIINRYTDDKNLTVSSKDEDILVVWDGARAGLVGTADGAVGSTLMRLTPKGILRDYLFFYLLSKYREINLNPRGTGIPHVNPDIFWEFEVPVPPETEQLLIVKKLKNILPEIEKDEKRLSNARRQIQKFRQAILTAAVTGKLTEDWRDKNPNKQTAQDLLSSLKITDKKKPIAIEFDKNSLPEIPETWEWVSFSQIGELARGKSKHRPRNDSRLFGGKYPFVQTGDVARSGGKISQYTQTYNEVGLSQSRLFPKGTLCITIAANIADTGILQIDACFPDSVVGFIPYEPIPSVDYFYYFVNTAKNNLEQFAPATAQKNINLGILNELAIPLPPLEEQNEIVKEVNNYLEIADKVEKQIEIAEKKVSKLTQAILAKTFSQE